MPGKSVDRVLEEATPDLMDLPGVAGTGQALYRGKPCIQVLVVALTPALRRKIPARLGGHPVRVLVTGEIRALRGSQRARTS